MLIFQRVKAKINKESNWKRKVGASLVAQWWRIRLPMQETRVLSLVWEDCTCHGATKSMHHNYWSPCALKTVLWDKRSPYTATREEPTLAATREKPSQQRSLEKRKENSYSQMSSSYYAVLPNTNTGLCPGSSHPQCLPKASGVTPLIRFFLPVKIYTQQVPN